MKHYTEKEIKKIRSQMNDGAEFCGIMNDKGVGLIYRSGEFINWKHFGSSANGNNDKELRWIIETIFKDCSEIVPCVWSAYHVNHVPVNCLYGRIDMSASHPNVYGL